MEWKEQTFIFMAISLIFVPLISADSIAPYAFRTINVVPLIILAEVIIF